MALSKAEIHELKNTVIQCKNTEIYETDKTDILQLPHDQVLHFVCRVLQRNTLCFLIV